jgi:hypothetical protein
MLRSVAATVLALALTPPGAVAATFYREGMCDNFKLVKRGNDLVVVCPTWQPTDWLTIKDIFLRCARVSATLRRNPTPLLTVTCSGTRAT